MAFRRSSILLLTIAVIVAGGVPAVGIPLNTSNSTIQSSGPYAGSALNIATSTSVSSSDWPIPQFDSAHSGHAPNATAPTLPVHARWQVSVSGDLVESVVVADGIAYIGVSGGDVIAYNATNGSVVWRTSLKTSGQIKHSLAVRYNRVYLATREEGAAVRIFALDADTGSIDWKQEYSGGSPYDLFSSPVPVNGFVYVGFGVNLNEKLCALDATTGQAEWCYNTFRNIRGDPSIANDSVFVTLGNGSIVSVDAITGTRKWITNAAGITTPTPVGGKVIFGTGNGDVVALNVQTGDVTWRWRSPTTEAIRTSPAVANGAVYVGTDGGYVYAIEASSGLKRWEYYTGNSVRSAPVVVGETAYVGASNHYVYAFNTTDGSIRWQYNIGDAVKTPLAIAQDSVFAVTEEDQIFALEADTEIAITNATGAPGDNVTVQLRAMSANVAGYQTTLQFNASKFQILNVSGADFDSPVVNISNDRGRVALAQAQARGESNPVLAELTIHINESAQRDGVISFRKQETLLTNAGGGNLSIDTYSNSSLSVQACSPGDANQDGSVTSGDATAVLRYLVGLSDGAISLVCADINADGAVTSADATVILRKIVGLPI